MNANTFAKQMMLLVPGVAIGGFAISQDETLSCVPRECVCIRCSHSLLTGHASVTRREQFHEIVLGVVALLAAVAIFAAYGIANDKFQCCKIDTRGMHSLSVCLFVFVRSFGSETLSLIVAGGNHRGRLETIT